MPKIFFQEFGESSLKFVIHVWAKAYNIPDEVKDAINVRIAARFAAEGIEIPFRGTRCPYEKIIFFGICVGPGNRSHSMNN